MNRFKSLLIGLALLLGLPAFGQTIVGNTTLSAALDTIPGSSNFSPVVAGAVSKIVRLASCTGVSAPSTTDNTKDTTLVIDLEWMRVIAVPTTSPCVVQVQRGASGTKAAPHVNGAVVFVFSTNQSVYFRTIPQGACTRSNEPLLPRIDPVTGTISDCLGGQWVNGDAVQNNRTTFSLLRLPEPGSNALTSLETAGTAAAASTEIYCTEIDLPFSMLLTGLAVLNGTTVGTNKHFAILYDTSGNVLANSATAGTTTSGASTYQKLNFTSKFYAVGPNRYFACDGLNGTTDTIRHAITSVNDNVLGGTVTGQTFGTAAAITVPTTFTTAKVPYFAVF